MPTSASTERKESIRQPANYSLQGNKSSFIDPDQLKKFLLCPDSMQPRDQPETDTPNSPTGD
ncbi:MAG: hypothetical protein GY703_06000 [Gammaproteobacteria bacterium]|nr:hypothetical protein [Gammaproteobacteria bacterium]